MTTYISVLVILLALGFLFRFPTVITRPIQELQKGILEITNKNYSHKVSIPNDSEMAMLATAFNQMSQQLHDYEQSNLAKLLFEKTRAEAVINSLKDAGIGIDNEGKILFANPQALSLLNLKAEDIIGKQIGNISERNDLFRFIVSDDQNTPFKIVQGGKDCFFTKEKTPIDIKGKSIGNLFTLKNITSFQEKDIAKTNFLATISHELKTPLSSTDFALKLLSNAKIGELNEEQKRLIQNIQNDNERLIKLVSELLDMSQAETGKINLNISTCKINEVVEYALSTLKSLIEQKRISIECIGFSEEVYITADKEKSIWVLVNILSNAIRYSPEADKITVSIINKTKDKVTISIKDNGPGIPFEHHASIFQRFYKVSDKEHGTGLGLSIAKEFMEAMNGKVYLLDDNKKGATFLLEFKLVSNSNNK